jgi:methyltransferase (TIGR00027 family)
LQRITRQPGIRQVVLLAAGLDTRAYRLSWPDHTRLFELDQPQVLQAKAETLQALGAQPACRRQALGVDLSEPWAEVLLEGRFDPRAPSGWLLEGFLIYLSPEQVERCLDEVTRLAAPRSWLGFDVINREVLTSPWTRPWIEMQAQAGAPWIGTLDDPLGFLAERGWQARLSAAGEADANFGRWHFPVIPITAPGMPHSWLVTAQKGSAWSSRSGHPDGGAGHGGAGGPQAAG